LGALEYAGSDGLVISCASDGNDNGPAAGAIADHVTCDATRKLKLSPYEYLASNSSYDFMKKTKAQIVTGKTGANVSDLMIAMKAKKTQ
jgi:glycerate-2-kinase